MAKKSLLNYSLFLIISLQTNLVLCADMKFIFEKAKQVGKFEFGIGSQVILETKDLNIAGRGLFLGRAVQPDGQSTS